MAKLSGVELKRARLVPSSVFTSPEEVVDSAELSRVQKVAILRRWEFDARGTDAMMLATQGAILSQIRRALATLGAAPPGHRAVAVTRH